MARAWPLSALSGGPGESHHGLSQIPAAKMVA